MRERRLSAIDADERLAWLIVLATIPVGITGLAFEHVFRTVFAKPVAASIFLFINGLILLAGERAAAAADEHGAGAAEARGRGAGSRRPRATGSGPSLGRGAGGSAAPRTSASRGFPISTA